MVIFGKQVGVWLDLNKERYVDIYKYVIIHVLF